MFGAALMTLLVGCGSDPSTGGQSPSSTDDPTSTANTNGKTPVKGQPTPPTGLDPSQTTTPVTPAKPTFAWSPDFADFPETTLGQSTEPKGVTLTNTSDVDAADVGLHLNGSQFVLGANECSGALKAHASCHVAITFHPSLAVAAEGYVYLMLGSVSQNDVVVHLTGTGKEAPGTDPGMSGPPVYPPGTYPMCAAGTSMGHTDAVCGTAEKPLKKDGFFCSLCLVGSTQECRPDTAGTLCVASCGECQ